MIEAYGIVIWIHRVGILIRTTQSAINQHGIRSSSEKEKYSQI